MKTAVRSTNTVDECVAGFVDSTAVHTTIAKLSSTCNGMLVVRYTWNDFVIKTFLS